MAKNRMKRVLRSTAYRMADEDPEFLAHDDARGVRLELEYLKAELQLRRHGVESTVIVMGSTNASRRDRHYAVARQLGRLIGRAGVAVLTGGGPGIMEAANRGAREVGAPSIGLNIDLPRPQLPNRYITPGLCLRFRYFALRKLHFLLRARALVCFPGGFGTLDELFEALTLVQTGKIARMPIVLVDRDWWLRAVDFEFLAAQRTIRRRDLGLFSYAETASEVCSKIRPRRAR